MPSSVQMTSRAMELYSTHSVTARAPVNAAAKESKENRQELTPCLAMNDGHFGPDRETFMPLLCNESVYTTRTIYTTWAVFRDTTTASLNYVVKKTFHKRRWTAQAADHLAGVGVVWRIGWSSYNSAHPHVY